MHSFNFFLFIFRVSLLFLPKVIRGTRMSGACHVWISTTLQHSATHCKHLHHSETCRYRTKGRYLNWYTYAATHCNTLQHTATHCNTVKHVDAVLTHCNTRQHTTTHCNTSIQTGKWYRKVHTHTATCCNTLKHTATRCNTLQHTVTHDNTLQPTAKHCKKLQHTVTHYNTLQHSATRPHNATRGNTP